MAEPETPFTAATAPAPAPVRHMKADRHFVTALARGLDVLRAFASGEERLSNQELAERCDLPKSTITRLTYTLTQLGYLHRVGETGRYRLGLATLGLGGTTQSRLDVKEASHPRLQALADRTGTLVAMAIRDQLSMLYIECCRSESTLITMRLNLGSRMPLPTTAVGRGYLAAAPEEVRQTLEERLRALNPTGWPAQQLAIRQAQDDLAQWGCVTSFGDWRPEINGIAAPLRLSADLPLMVVNAAAATDTVSADQFLQEVRPVLLATLREIASDYGRAA
ncbi:IclR family transcriptional regulator [Ottowia flava]|uniref:IclR family transcriptional regulator n=1 Tax=Ottowia flava TaxID=2675430 RepID=A0ABW4KVE7_9BURK|nr:IclR family transcriptional regulator [Ottowia sp. GY511]